MFTREDAMVALKDYYGRNSSDIVGFYYMGMVLEPDGVLAYFFQVSTEEFANVVTVYTDDDGINIEEW